MPSAARAAVDPHPSYHLRKVTEATDYLESVRLGPAERGSYVLTVFSSVQPRLGGRWLKVCNPARWQCSVLGRR